MKYVDGTICAVATADREAFTAFCKNMAGLFKEFGALSVVDCWGDDVPDGKLTSFPMAVKCEPHETVALGWITWPSKQVRDEAWAKLMADPRMQEASMPFDGKRLIHGGFETISSV